MRFKSGIYFIENIKSKKIYIGSAINLRKRLYAHYWNLKKQNHYNFYLQRSWAKYGEENFRFGILQRTSKFKLIEREQYWIDYYKSYKAERGYNICPKAGNSLGYRHSFETRQKMAEVQKKMRRVGESNNFYGKRHSLDSRMKMSKIHKNKIPWNKGLSWSDEVKAKISKAIKGRKLTPEWKRKIGESSKGKNHTLETKRKLSLIRRKWWKAQKFKEILERKVA